MCVCVAVRCPETPNKKACVVAKSKEKSKAEKLMYLYILRYFMLYAFHVHTHTHTHTYTHMHTHAHAHAHAHTPAHTQDRVDEQRSLQHQGSSKTRAFMGKLFKKDGSKDQKDVRMAFNP
jgi:hypothetical protein